ncbi:hypothetical protein ACFLXU_02335 [Chloroflexota bacterium]
MKGLLITILVISVLILSGLGASIVITRSLINRLDAVSERGFEEGYAQGYVGGLWQGGEVGYQEGSKIGYEEGSMGHYSHSSDYGTGFYFIYNPTCDEVQEILAEDETDSVVGIHDCARANGVRVAYVRCQIARQAAKGMVYVYHLVAFETVDKGLIIVEPWSNREVEVEVGKSYSVLNDFLVPPYDDTITKVTMVW